MGALDGIKDLYRVRFDPAEKAAKDKLWKILCAYLQRWFPADGAVLDVGAGYCEFINHIKAARKVAVDMNPDTVACAAPGVTVVTAPVVPLPFLEPGSMDAAFLSNLLEHLADKAQVMDLLREIHRVLRVGGRIVILMPNIRFAYREYWDFFDHQVPLTEKAVVEACLMAGFEPIKVIPAFLPYTTKSRLPQWGFLVHLYLAVPLLWRFFGKQALVVAEKRAR
ncbi:MAG: class I SAM-dependent methyltransferase [Fibrobacterota bacterium]|nr:class I SAM-dependent methyltransferase [Fibrobacterota bacterium]